MLVKGAPGRLAKWNITHILHSENISHISLMSTLSCPYGYYLEGMTLTYQACTVCGNQWYKSHSTSPKFCGCRCLVPPNMPLCNMWRHNGSYKVNHISINSSSDFISPLSLLWFVGMNLTTTACWWSSEKYEAHLAYNKFLTHCGLVAPYGDRDLGQHWLR